MQTNARAIILLVMFNALRLSEKRYHTKGVFLLIVLRYVVVP